MSAVVVTPNYPMRVAAPQQHRELGCIRIRIGSQRAHVTFPKSGKPFDTCNPAGKLFQSVRFSSLRAGIADWLSVSSAPGRLFNFSRPLKASGGLIPSLRVQPAKQSRGGFSKCFRSFSSVLSHETDHGRRNGQGAVKE